MVQMMVDVPQNDDGGALEIKGPGGTGLKAPAKRMLEIIAILLACGVVWLAWEMKAHGGESEKQSKAIVKSINDASDRMVKALERVADEQKATNAELRQVKSAQRESNCLQDPAMRNRPDAREVCKRLSGGDR